MDNPTKSNKIQQLNTKQQKAIDLLLKGKTDTEVAIAVGVGRDTVNRWRNHNADFIAALNEQSSQLDEDLTVRLSRLYFWSLEVIESALAKADVAAALAVMQALVPSDKINTQPHCKVTPKLTVLDRADWNKKDNFEASLGETDGTAS